MRRKHCEVTDPKEMARILAATNIGRLATMDAEGYPYITPVNFVFYGGCVYFHCAPEGEKLANLLRNPRVCLEADVPLAYLEGVNLANLGHRLYVSEAFGRRSPVATLWPTL